VSDTANSAALRLRAIAGELEGQTWPLNEHLFVIGRGTGCHVRLDDEHVSRRHCEIRLEHGAAVLYDQQSRNSTLLNGRPVSQSVLRPGDVISIYANRFYVEPDESREPAGDASRAPIDPTPITAPLSEAIHLRHEFDAARYLDNPGSIEELFELFALSRDLAKIDTLEALLAALETHVRARLAPEAFWLAWHIADEDDFVLYSPVPTAEVAKTPYEAFRQARDAAASVLLPYNTLSGPREVLAAPLLHGSRCFAVIAIERAGPVAPRGAQALQYLAGVAESAGPLVRAVERLEQLRRDAGLDAQDTGGGAVPLGDTPVMTNLRASLIRAARGSGNVLLLGETGVGKELAARYVHDHSARAEGPYVVVNCAAIPAGLFESEVFGHTAGAFTGAARPRRGLFQIAHGGTLFLDEIGELTPENQARLLRVVETGTFRPLGSNDELRVKVRVIGASNRPLREPESGFRADLLHRLGTFIVELPPLREHRDDVPVLARHFLSRFAVHAPSHLAGFTQGALGWLQSQQWPGNVRELRNAIERACQTAHGPLITPEDLTGSVGPLRAPVAEADRPTLDEYEKRYVVRVYEECDGNIAEAARILGVARSTLYHKLGVYGIRV